MEEKKIYKVGYTQGTYDLFHVGHLNLLNNAKKMCDFLVVGINSDKLVQEYKEKNPVISENDRAKIVNSIKGVDKVLITTTLDKIKIYEQIKFDAIFIGDDWKGNNRWEKTKKELSKYNVDVVFLPHTDGISTTQIMAKLKNK